MKKNSALLLLLPVLLLVGGLFFIIVGDRSSKDGSGKPTPVPEKLVKEKPYITLIPGLDGHRATLNIGNIEYGKTLEFEIHYDRALTDEKGRVVPGEKVGGGIIGDNISINGLSYSSEKKLFGSASSGVEKFDKEVQGTDLIVRFRGDGGTLRYETQWRLSPGQKKLVSADENFSFEGELPKNSFYIIMDTVGLPKPVLGEVVGGPYGIFTEGGISVKGKIKFNFSTSSSQVKIFGWDSLVSDWKEYAKGLQRDGDTVSLEVDRLTVFVAIKS